MIQLLVVDDHPAYRRGLEVMLADTPDIQIVGEADTGERAVELATSLAPTVILMDLRMPDLDGIEATRRLTKSGSTAAVVVLTMFEDDESVFAAMRAGARGYVLKGAEQEEIERAIGLPLQAKPFSEQGSPREWLRISLVALVQRPQPFRLLPSANERCWRWSRRARATRPSLTS